MANPHRGEASIALDGETYVLKFSLNSICEIEDMTGQSINDTLKQVQANDFRAVRAVLWGSLLDHHPDITLKEAGALIPEGGLTSIIEALSLAVTRSFPDATEADEAAGNPQSASPKAGTGKRSK